LPGELMRLDQGTADQGRANAPLASRLNA